jgi:hypothetical protein
MSAPEAFGRIRQFFETDVDVRRLDPGMTWAFEEGDMSGTLTGSQLSASFRVRPDAAGSLVSVVVELPLVLALLKGQSAGDPAEQADEAPDVNPAPARSADPRLSLEAPVLASGGRGPLPHRLASRSAAARPAAIRRTV